MSPLFHRNMNTDATKHQRRPAAASSLLAALVLTISGTSALAQHGHLNAGAVGTTIGDKLLWANGALFAEGSGYVQEMPLATDGIYAGYYNSGPTFTALPATVANGGPAAFAANLGSVLAVQMTLMSAPAGGMFAFWEGGSLAPTLSVGLGATSDLWELSDTVSGAGTAGADPYGHLHGRRFTATVPGEYVVGYQLFDTSDLAPGATPFHTPSDILYIKYSALVVPEPGTMALVGAGLVGLFVRSRWTRRDTGV